MHRPSGHAEQVKALAIASRKRTPLQPDVPTFSEAGMSGFGMGSRNGVLAPARTPAATIRRLNTGINRGMQDGAPGRATGKSRQGCAQAPVSCVTSM